ncbi:MAG TPA: hypothetical protein VN635_02630 [Conexibacter sp.]|nr:hypothetical protein [Conexibacter sp.]
MAAHAHESMHATDSELAEAQRAGASDALADSSQAISTLAGAATFGAVVGGPEGAIIGGIIGAAIGGGAAVARHIKGK